MKNNELHQLLKAARTPERADEYWLGFPKKVTAKLHWQSAAASRPIFNSPRQSRPVLIWSLMVIALGLATGGLIKIHHAHSNDAVDGQLLMARKCYHEIEALFPHQVRGIVFDQQGPHMLLGEKADLPDSDPLYLRICGSDGCQGFVTFSGQQIMVNGENCEVLANAEGGVMLVGNRRVWTGTSPTDAIKIEVRLLEVAL